MGRKTSIVWNHFTIPVLYPKKALCNYCRQLVCRGQNNLGTTSLMNHLKRCQEFKSTVWGISNVNEMMSSVISGNEVQNSNTQEERTLSESNGPSDFPIPFDVFDEKESEQWNPESTSLHLMPSMDDSPSFVGRRLLYSSGHAPVREYQSKDRSSTLLYGDISSTSEQVEEPSSSSTSDNSFITAPASELMSYTSASSCVDLVYGGVVLHMLYQQYKVGKYCDMHIVTQKMPTNEVTISETGKIMKKNLPFEKHETKISVHASLLAGLSRKINSLVEMGCNTIQLKKGGTESVRGLMEIAYTGKLEKIRLYSEMQLLEILEVARFLEVDYAVQYLMREIPEEKARPKNNPHKMFQEKLLSLTQQKQPCSLGRSSPGNTGNRHKGVNSDSKVSIKKTSVSKEHPERIEIPALEPLYAGISAEGVEDSAKISSLVASIPYKTQKADEADIKSSTAIKRPLPSGSLSVVKTENESLVGSPPQDSALDLKRHKAADGSPNLLGPVQETKNCLDQHT